MLAIYCNEGVFTCNVNNKINDIFESANVIVTVGVNFIEVFQLDVNNKTLYKKYSISLNDNIPNNNNIITINNDNSNSDNEILCIELANNQFLVCGHSSGLISVWKPLSKEPFIQKLQGLKMFKSRVNKILYMNLQNVNYIFMCSSDKTVKKYCMDTNQSEKEANFDNEVLCIKKVEEFYSQEQNIHFIISLLNGELCLLDTDINILFKIPSRFNTIDVRQVLSIDNPEKNDKKGSFLLISESNKIDIFVWIKEGSFEFHLPKKDNNFHGNQNHGAQFKPPYFPGGFIPGRGGRGRGGKGGFH